MTKRPDLREAMARIAKQRIGMAGYAAILGSVRTQARSTGAGAVGSPPGAAACAGHGR